MDVKVKAIEGASWIAATRIFVNIAGIVSTLLLTRLLSPDDFGLVAIATTAYVIVTSMTELSLSSALIQMQEVDDSYYDTSFTLGIIKSVLISILVAASAPFIAHLYGDDRLTDILLALAGSTLISGSMNPKYISFARTLDYRQEFWLNTFSKFSGLGAAFFIAYPFQSYWALVVGSVVSQIITVIVSYFQIPYRPALSFRNSRKILNFSIWIVFSQFVNTVNWRFDQLFVGYFLGKSHLGAYSVGDNLASMPTRELTQPLAQVLFPAFSRMQNEPDRVRSAYQLALVSLVSVALPAGVGFAMIADPFVRLFLGPEWLEAIPVIQVISIVIACQTLAGPAQPIALSFGATKLLFYRDLITLFYRIPLTLTGLILAGLPGLLAGRAVSSMVGIVINMLLVTRLTGMTVSQQLSANKRNFVALTIMIVAGLCLQRVIDHSALPFREATSIAGTIVVAGFSYLGMLWVLWVSNGHPQGPEAEAARLISKFTHSVRKIAER